MPMAKDFRPSPLSGARGLRLALLLALASLAFGAGPALAQGKPGATPAPFPPLPTVKPPALPPIGGGRPGPQAQTPAPPQQSGLAGIEGPVCTPEHLAAINTAVAEARAHLPAAIQMVRQQPNHAHVTRWFGTAPRETIRSTLDSTAALLADMNSLKLRCNDPRGCVRGRFAYTLPLARTLTLCPPFFNAGAEGADSRWGILIHEGTHIAARTGDHAYGRNSAAQLAKEDPERAAVNADSYEYFVETLPR